MQVVDVEHAGDVGDGVADVGECDRAGVPSSRMLRVSRTMVTELQTIMPAIRSESTGSIHMTPVNRMAAPPAMTAAVESVSPSMCRKTLRMLTSPEELPEQGGDGAVHQDAGGGDGHHEARLDGDRGVEAVDGGEGDPGGEDDEGEGVDEGGEDAGALVAEGLLVGGRAGLEVDGGEGEQDGEQVGDVVAGFGDEGEGVGTKAEVEGGKDVGRRQRHRELQDALHFPVRAGDHVHDLSVVRVGTGVQSVALMGLREASILPRSH